MAFEPIGNSASLEILLRDADINDLDILVDYITDAGKGRVSLSSSTCKRLVACKEARLYPAVDRNEIAEEILLFGGNSVANMFRGGKGVPYLELVADVADHLKVPFAKGSGVEEIEQAIISSLYEGAVSKMSPETRTSFQSSLATNNRVSGDITSSPNWTYFKSATVAEGAAASILGFKVATMSPIALFLGPMGLMLSGIWSAADLAGAAYRVTVPCVIQIALMRQKALKGAYDYKCAKCSKINSRDAKFCSECGAPLKQDSKAFIA